MKKNKTILLGVLFSIFFLLFVNGFLTYLVLLLLNLEITKYSIAITGVSLKFTLNNGHNIYLNSLILLSPIIINIIVLEFSFLLLKKLKKEAFRNFIISFVLIIIGYIIITIFYGLFELIILDKTHSLWGRLTDLWQLEGNQIFAFIFFVIVVLFAYLQITQKRLMGYLTLNTTREEKS
jgi:hypothetical protein